MIWSNDILKYMIWSIWSNMEWVSVGNKWHVGANHVQGGCCWSSWWSRDSVSETGWLKKKLGKATSTPPTAAQKQCTLYSYCYMMGCMGAPWSPLMLQLAAGGTGAAQVLQMDTRVATVRQSVYLYFHAKTPYCVVYVSRWLLGGRGEQG